MLGWAGEDSWLCELPVQGWVGLVRTVGYVSYLYTYSVGLGWCGQLVMLATCTVLGWAGEDSWLC